MTDIGETRKLPLASNTSAVSSRADAPNLSLASFGPGFTYQFGRFAAARFSYAIDAHSEGVAGPTLGPQFSVQINY